jgi:UDP-N-acetylmuramate--alanine ligase
MSNTGPESTVPGEPRGGGGAGLCPAGVDAGQGRGALDGRRIWFVGIGGAGLSAYAFLARAWGADVGGWDRVATPYLHRLRDVEIEITPDPVVREGWEVVVSTAYSDRVDGRSRADFLAELISLRPQSIVVAGAHGKSTTSAMIAFALAELGHDPAWLIGAEIPQLGGNAGAGEGPLVVEGDESDRTVERLRPGIAVVTNIELDHHATFGSAAELRFLFERWLEHVPQVVRGWTLEPVSFELALRGRHNRCNAAAALAALELAGVERAAAAAVLARFRGATRRYECVGVAGGVTVVDDYAHHPSELAAVIAAAREQTDGRVLALFQPHLYSRTRHLAREFGAALSDADAVCVTEIYRAREEPVPGVTGKLVLDALAPGTRAAWAPTVEDGARIVRVWARPGDLVLTLGAGDVDRAGRLLMELL